MLASIRRTNVRTDLQNDGIDGCADFLGMAAPLFNVMAVEGRKAMKRKLRNVQDKWNFLAAGRLFA